MENFSDGLIVSGTGVRLGAGATTPALGNHVEITGADETNVADAVAAGSYIEFDITTADEPGRIAGLTEYSTVAPQNTVDVAMFLDGQLVSTITVPADPSADFVFHDLGEAISLANDTTHTIRLVYFNSASDIIVDSQSFNIAAKSAGLTPVDTDSDTTADYLDLDTDGDGVEDAAERGTAGPTMAQTGIASDAMTDTDGDGLLNVFEGSDSDDGFDVNDENRAATSIALADTDGDLNGAGTNADPLNIDSDFRDTRVDIDTDDDGVVDADDIDDDNDGILDVDENQVTASTPADQVITELLVDATFEGATAGDVIPGGTQPAGSVTALAGVLEAYNENPANAATVNVGAFATVNGIDGNPTLVVDANGGGIVNNFAMSSFIFRTNANLLSGERFTLSGDFSLNQGLTGGPSNEYGISLSAPGLDPIWNAGAAETPAGVHVNGYGSALIRNPDSTITGLNGAGTQGSVGWFHQEVSYYVADNGSGELHLYADSSGFQYDTATGTPIASTAYTNERIDFGAASDYSWLENASLGANFDEYVDLSLIHI